MVLDLEDEIPNAIWLTVFFILLILSILISIDSVIKPMLSIVLLFIIWLPTLVVYSIFIQKEDEIDNLLKELEKKLNIKHIE